MKRIIKRLIDWFTNWIKKFDWEQIVAFVISGLLGIALAITMFVYSDIVPATSSDYAELYEQVNTVKDLDSLLETDCDNIKDGIITVMFENDECKIVAKYDKNFKVLSTSKKDKYTSWIIVLIRALIAVIAVYFVGGYLLLFVILVLEETFVMIFKKIKKLAAKLKKE